MGDGLTGYGGSGTRGAGTLRDYTADDLQGERGASSEMLDLIIAALKAGGVPAEKVDPSRVRISLSGFTKTSGRLKAIHTTVTLSIDSVVTEFTEPMPRDEDGHE